MMNLPEGLMCKCGCVRPSISCNLFAPSSFQRLSMLRGDDNCVDLPWFHGPVCFLQIFNRNLCLAVRPQPPQQTTLTHICQFLTKTRGHGVGQWHAILSFI